MEYYENGGFLEELLALESDSWELNSSNITMGMEIEMAINDQFYSNYNNVWPSSGCTVLDSFAENTVPMPPPSTTTAVAAAAAAAASYDEYSSNYLPFDHSQNYPFTDFYSPPLPPLGDERLQHETSPPLAESSSTKMEALPTFSCGGEDLSSIMLEPVVQSASTSADLAASQSGFSVGLWPENKKGKSKKVEGQPSKNLMAERRRRKRLNDRLSMLRSVVPKISKMDRTSILGDTIDYMKELQEKINNLQEELELGTNELSLMSIFKNEKPNEMVVRNSPKIDVESRGEIDTRIEICCGGKPGLLLSTLAALETLGLEIQQCVISCLSDFAMQASCTQELEQREVLSSEDIRQALFRNAGYGTGGKCY